MNTFVECGYLPKVKDYYRNHELIDIENKSL